MIKVYGNVRTRAFRIFWLLHELQLEYQQIPIDFGQQEHRSDWFLQLNPLGKVPTIDIDGLVMFESAAIVTFLCERYDTQALMMPPASSTEKAHFLQWMHFIMSELDQALWVIAKNKFAYPKHLRCADARPGALYDFEKSIQVVMQHFENTSSPYLVGDQFGAADLLLTTIITWTRVLKIPQHVPSTLHQWAEKNMQRPAFKAAMANQ